MHVPKVPNDRRNTAKDDDGRVGLGCVPILICMRAIAGAESSRELIHRNRCTRCHQGGVIVKENFSVSTVFRPANEEKAVRRFCAKGG